MKHSAKIYKEDNRIGFESRVYLATIAYDTDEEFEKAFAELRKANFANCHTVYTIIQKY